MQTSRFSNWVDQCRPYTLALLRIVAGFLLWQHGVWKLFGWFGGKPVPVFQLFWFAGVIETICASFVAFGLLTRPFAFILCGEMAVAYLTQHQPKGFWPIQNQGLVPLQFCFIFLLLATAGAGRFALDGLFRRDASNEPGWCTRKLSPLYPAALTLLRLMTAFLFWQFGARKFFGWLGGRAVKFGTRIWVAGVMETFGAPLIALGAITRPLAFLFSGEMAVAYWTSHFPRGPGFWPIQNGGEAAVLFSFIYLFLVTSGAGKCSLDYLLSGKRAPTKPI